MSLESTLLKVKEPHYFHREYQNDLFRENSEANSAINQGVRIVQAALPFLAIYKPAGSVLTVLLGGCRTISNASQAVHSILEGENQIKVGCQILQTAVGIVSLGCVFFAHPLGMLVTTCHDLGINCIQMHQAWIDDNSKNAREAGIQILNNSIYLGLFFSGSSEVLVASLAFQVLLGLYQSTEEFKKGNYLELFAGLLMVGIRANQCARPILALQAKWKIENLENNNITLQAIEDCNSAKSEILSSDAEMSTLNANECSNQEVINVLIKYGNNPDNIPALHYAIKSGDLGAVKILAEHNANVNLPVFVTGYGHQTPIHLAVQQKDIEMVKYLHSKGAQLDLNSVRSAARLNFAVGLNFLLENKAPMPANSGLFLWEVLSWGYVDSSRILIEHGADCTFVKSYRVKYCDNKTNRLVECSEQVGILTWAVKFGDENLIKMLIDKGALFDYCLSANHINELMVNNRYAPAIYFNPLYMAIAQKNETIASLLLARNATVSRMHEHFFNTEIARDLDKAEQLENLKLLLKLKVLSSESLDISFYKALLLSNIEVMKEILAHGAIMKDEYLIDAARLGDRELIAWLLDHGAKP